MNIRVRNILYGAFACTSIRCCDPWILASILARFSTKGEKPGELIDRMLKDLSPSNALAILIKEDLKTVVSQNSSLLYCTSSELERSMELTFDWAKQKAENHGLTVPLAIRYHLVDEFPGIYTGQDFWALSLDETDAEECNCAPGIYIRSDMVFPGVSPITVCHELVHSLLSIIPSVQLARGLEEGLCDIVGCLLCFEFLGNSETVNVLLNTRFPNMNDKRESMYIDHLRQVACLISQFGIESILSIVYSVQKEGRDVLYEIEDSLITRDFHSLQQKIKYCNSKSVLVSAEWQEFTSRLCLDILSFPESYTLSPSAILLSRAISTNKTISEAIESSSYKSLLNIDDAHELEELYLILEDDKGRLISNECPRYITSHNYHYSISDEDIEILSNAL